MLCLGCTHCSVVSVCMCSHAWFQWITVFYENYTVSPYRHVFIHFHVLLLLFSYLRNDAESKQYFCKMSFTGFNASFLIFGSFISVVFCSQMKLCFDFMCYIVKIVFKMLFPSKEIFSPQNWQ